MKKNLLVTLADRNYILQAKQLFSSVYWNAGWRGDYMLLAHEIPEKELKWFRDKGILIKKCKPLSDKGWGCWPPTLLDKFYLFTPEFKKWKNIIYLDADIIVRANLNELTKVKGFSAVNDFYGKLKDQFKINIPQEIKRKYNLNKLSFNAGIFAFDTSIIEDNTFDDLNFLFKKYSPLFKYGEQTALNLYFYNRWRKESFIYNVCIDDFHYHHIPLNGIIFHFAGRNKSWDSLNSFHSEWRKNLEKAELIDLENIPEGKKWSKFKIIAQSIKINLILFLSLFFINFKKNIQIIEKIIGKIGIFLKKESPNLYYFLKKYFF